MGVADQQLPRLRGHRGFVLFWTASTVSAFGSYVTTVALGVLVVVDLGGSATEVGWVNAARWVPYLAVGLVAGVLADRVRRKPLLVGTDLGRAVVLAVVPVLAATGALGIGALIGLLLAFGLLSVAHDAAHQSLLPRLVPGAALHRANTRLEQSDAVAQTSGPLLSGALVGWLGAPLAVLVDAVSYAVSGLLLLVTPVHDPRPARAARGPRVVLAELTDGLRWVYRHPTLRPLALSTHAWFLCNAVLGTVYVPYALLVLDVGPLGLGITMAGAGVGGLVGSSLSVALTRRLGVARTVPAARLLEAAGFGVVAVVPAAGVWDAPAVIAIAAVGQLLFGSGLGIENPIELSYRQSVTPDALQGRMNATMRSLNRASMVVGAPLGGALATATSPRVALVIGAAGIAAGAVALARSGFRSAGMDPAPDQPAGGASTGPSSSAPAR